MKEIDNDHRHPVVEPERYEKFGLEQGDIPLYNYGEDTGAVGAWWD